MISLRQYQKEVLTEATESMRAGIRKMILMAPTGSGKTVLAAFMLDRASSQGFHSLFIVHRRELINQSTRTFSEFEINHGIIANGYMPDNRHNIQLVNIGSLAKRVDKIKKPKFIIWDECHHIAAKSWEKIYSRFPDAIHIGLTATPQRLDAKGLVKYFDKIIFGPSVQWLIENKFLSDYRIYSPSTINTDGIKTIGGDFSKHDLESAADRPSITGDAVSHYKKLAYGKRAVAFCTTIEHSKHVAAQFNAEGIPAMHVDGDTDPKARDEATEKLQSGELMVLTNVDLFGEGYNLPSLEVSILLRPTQSLGLYLQQIGRCLRISPGKIYAIILDHAGNLGRHGLPDEDREWSLEGKDRNTKKINQEVKIKICSKCFAAQRSFNKVCQFCGAAFESKEMVVDHKDGELQEIDVNKIRKNRKQEEAMARTYEDLVLLGKSRGYKFPEQWARIRMSFRKTRTKT